MNPDTTRNLRINLLVLLGYAVAIQGLSMFESRGADFTVAILMMLAVAAHIVVLVILALVSLATKRGAPATTWLLSALLVAIVGLGTCAGGIGLTRFYSEPGNLH